MPQMLPLMTFSVTECLPPEAAHVLVWHAAGLSIGARYGAVWREAEGAEAQLYEVTRWSMVPLRAADITTWEGLQEALLASAVPPAPQAN